MCSFCKFCEPVAKFFFNFVRCAKTHERSFVRFEKLKLRTLIQSGNKTEITISQERISTLRNQMELLDSKLSSESEKNELLNSKLSNEIKKNENLSKELKKYKMLEEKWSETQV